MAHISGGKIITRVSQFQSGTTLRRGQAGIAITFLVAGVLSGIWATRIPALAERFHLDHGQIGLVILIWGAGAFACMQGLRGLIGRIGSRRIVRLAGPLRAVSLAAAAFAPSYGLLLGTAVVSGVASGLLDVGMNAQASALERAYRRPLMSGMHARWSVGALAGGLAGAASAWLGLSFTQSVAGTALLCLPALVIVGPAYVADGSAARPRAERVRLPRTVYLIGVIGFAAFLLEGSVADWGGLFLRQSLGTSEPVAALAYPLFGVAMVGGRFIGDRLRAHFGPRTVITWGSGASAAAMALVIVAPAPWAALIGFLLMGAGASTVIPLVLSLAGTTARTHGAAAIAQTSTMGYTGLLLGPVAIGFIADQTSLGPALALVVVLSLIAAALARLIPAWATSTTRMTSQEHPARGEPEPVPAAA